MHARRIASGDARMTRFALGLALLSVAAGPALAAGTRAPSPAQQAQQERMRDCSGTAKARGLHGAGRKDFMKGCLGRHAAAPG